MIFDSPPATWQELEELVCQAFCEMRYESYRNHQIKTVRGRVKIDVYAINKSTPIPTIILCECKYWNKPIEQGIIHGFRTICSDIGAHFGIIISKKGFQSGANESREATNIHLYDFTEFQHAYFEEWRTGIFMKLAQMTDELLPLLPMNPHYVDDAKHQAKLKSVAVFDKYSVFFGEHRYSNYFIEKGAFPIVTTDPRGDPHILKKITVHSHRQYFQIAQQAHSDARDHFGI